MHLSDKIDENIVYVYCWVKINELHKIQISW